MRILYTQMTGFNSSVFRIPHRIRAGVQRNSRNLAAPDKKRNVCEF